LIFQQKVAADFSGLVKQKDNYFKTFLHSIFNNMAPHEIFFWLTTVFYNFPKVYESFIL